MGSLLPLLGLLIPVAIQTVEKIFPSSGSGTDKMSVVVQQVRAVVDKLIATKTPLPGGGPLMTAPTDEFIQGLVESELAKMKVSGTLNAPGIGPMPAGSAFLVYGTVTALPGVTGVNGVTGSYLGPLQK